MTLGDLNEGVGSLKNDLIVGQNGECAVNNHSKPVIEFSPASAEDNQREVHEIYLIPLFTKQ